MEIVAALARTPAAPFEIERIILAEPLPHEVRVRVVATGLCHTDIVVRDQILPTPLPAVLGHEGAGIIEAVGNDVTGLAPGDPVVMGFAACHKCESCATGQPAYCVEFAARNFGGSRPNGSKALTTRSGEAVSSHFFGQSSFATHALVAAADVVKVPASAPLDILGPLGCGFMTGAGAIINRLQPQAGETVLVSGGGPVGLSGIMAAAALGAPAIILVDPLASRRALALDLGATHVVDPGAGSVAEQVRAILPGGVHCILESSGHVPAIEQAAACLGRRGRLAMVGVPKSLDAAVSLAILPMLSLGTSFHGVTEGDADPQLFIPKLIDMYLAGQFPFDRLITKYPLTDINRAIDDQHAGRCVKAVLTMD